jgi:hypothetical protein
MNTAITTEEVQKGLMNLNVVYKAAMATMPTGLVEAATVAQQKGLNDAAQDLADLLNRCDNPTVTAVDDVDVITPKKK